MSMLPPRVAILHQGCVPIFRRAFCERLGVCVGQIFDSISHQRNSWPRR